jgi:hypothetical protein
MPDQPTVPAETAPHPLVAAVLVGMPIDVNGDGTGETVVGWDVEYVGRTDGGDAGEYHMPVTGPPEPLAATYAVAVLRALAEMRRQYDAPVLDVFELDDMADEIEGGSDGR